jgi:hypothetical protein
VGYQRAGRPSLEVYRTKEFTAFAKRARITDVALCEAIARTERGLVDADLGGGLIKQRVARPGQGRSGGFRTLIAYRRGIRGVFVYGFAKSERGNIGPDELVFWRKIAQAILAMGRAEMTIAMTAGEIVEVLCDEED